MSNIIAKGFISKNIKEIARLSIVLFIAIFIVIAIIIVEFTIVDKAIYGFLSLSFFIFVFYETYIIMNDYIYYKKQIENDVKKILHENVIKKQFNTLNI